MNNILDNPIIEEKKYKLLQSKFKFIRNLDCNNYLKYDIEFLILLNKKFSYPMFSNSSNKEKVDFSYIAYYVMDNDEYDFLDEIYDQYEEDECDSIISVIEIKIMDDTFKFELKEIIEFYYFNKKDILQLLDQNITIYLWGCKYYIDNNNLYKESYL